MNKQLLQLKKEFGKYGSWALWDENGGIEKMIKDKKLKSFIKPNVIFMGLNASYDLRNADDWRNYHFIKNKKKSSWKKEHCRKLAEVLSEPEFSYFRGAYMTDIIKTKYDPNSGDLMRAIKNDESIIIESKKLLKREMELLSKISGSEKFRIICIGSKSFKILNKVLKHKVDKIWHYSAYQLGHEGVKERIRQDLKKIIKQHRTA